METPFANAVTNPRELEEHLTAERLSLYDRHMGISTPERYTILLVEDSVMNQRVVSRQLSKLDHTVIIAQHGQEALEVLKTTSLWKNNIDGAHLSFILMDVKMPVMGGATCASIIRSLQHEGTVICDVPVIAITGNARDEKVNIAKAAGMVCA